MPSLEFVYLLASSAAVVAMAPQVKKLVTARRSDELSLPSWFVWAAAQVISLVYTISLHIVPFIIINSVWMAYYAAMVGLIIYFRYRPGTVHAPTEQLDIVDQTTLVPSEPTE